MNASHRCRIAISLLSGICWFTGSGNAVSHAEESLNAPESARTAEPARFIDHSLLISSEYPCNWPTYPFPKFQIVHQRGIGAVSPYHVDSLYVDGNTGTQLDTPPHSVARPDLKREKSGPLGLAYTDKIEPWQFGGEACVVDVRDLLDQDLFVQLY